MRATIKGLAVAAAMLPFGVAAQQEQAPQVQRPVLKIVGDIGGLTAEDRQSYCLWAGQLYSIGSSFCSRQQTASTCTEVQNRRPMWVNKENDKFCDKNPSLTPQ
jgi:hypothetical protein